MLVSKGCWAFYSSTTSLDANQSKSNHNNNNSNSNHSKDRSRYMQHSKYADLMYCRCYMHRVQKTRCPLVQEKLFCLWDKYEFLFTHPKDKQTFRTQFLCTFSGQLMNHACSFSSFQLERQLEIRVGQGKRKTHSSPLDKCISIFFLSPDANFLSA